jgi:hypothetical protein
MPSPNNFYYTKLRPRTLKLRGFPPPNTNTNARTRRLRELNHRRHLNELAKAGYTYTNENSSKHTKINRQPLRINTSPLAKQRSVRTISFGNKPINGLTRANKTRIELLKQIYNHKIKRVVPKLANISLNELNALNTTNMTTGELRELLIALTGEEN